jgi:hypothetical protein
MYLKCGSKSQENLTYPYFLSNRATLRELKPLV